MNIKTLVAILSLAFASAQAFGLSNSDVLRMTAAGLPPEAVVAAIEAASERDFDLTADGLIALKEGNVPNEAIVAMLQSTNPKPAKRKLSTPTAAGELAQGCYFRQNGELSRGEALADPEIRMGGKAWIPIANLGNVPFYAWFRGDRSQRVLKPGDQIVVAGWDVRPFGAIFKTKDGRRYATMSRYGEIPEKDKLPALTFDRDENNNFVATVPEGIPPGEYWVCVPIQGRETPAFDFAVR